MSEKLKPCPFCGVKANVFLKPSEAFVICSKCFGKNSVSFPCKDAAIKAWNTRPSITISREELEGLRLKDIKVGGATMRAYGQNEGRNALITELLEKY